MKSLTEADFEQFKNNNRSVELIQRQYEFLVHGTALQKEIKAATLGDGIQKLNPQTEATALENFNKHKDSISCGIKWKSFQLVKKRLDTRSFPCVAKIFKLG